VSDCVQAADPGAVAELVTEIQEADFTPKDLDPAEILRDDIERVLASVASRLGVVAGVVGAEKALLDDVVDTALKVESGPQQWVAITLIRSPSSSALVRSRRCSSRRPAITVVYTVFANDSPPAVSATRMAVSMTAALRATWSKHYCRAYLSVTAALQKLP
jgi:hypothetical protein